MYWLVPTFPMGVLHGNRDRVEPPCPNLAKSRDPPANPIGEQPNSAVALGSRNNRISIQPEECADEWRQSNADLKLLENCVMNGFIIFGIMFMTAIGLENSPQSFGVYTVHSLVPWWRPRSVVTSIGELRNGHVANLQELYYTRLVRKMAWYKILIHMLIV